MKFSILFNGSPCGFIGGSRGLRQGDPLLALIFSLVAESFTQCFLRAQQDGLIRGFSVKGGDVIPIIQYADDTMVFIEALKEMVQNTKLVFQWFGAPIGLHVNIDKTKVYNLNVADNWETLRVGWNCIVGVLPDSYSVLPLGTGSDADAERFWAGKKDIFTVKSASVMLNEERCVKEDLGIANFPAKQIWNVNFVPPKVAFFTWTLLCGKILTVDNLRKRGLQLISRCIFCKADLEIIDHVFCNFPALLHIWSYFGTSLSLDFGRNKLTAELPVFLIKCPLFLSLQRGCMQYASEHKTVLWQSGKLKLFLY